MQNTAQALEWPLIHRQLIERCVSPLGKSTAEALAFSTDVEHVREQLALLRECRSLRHRYGTPPTGRLHPLTLELSRLTKGGILSSIDLGMLLETLHTAHAWSEHLRKSLLQENKHETENETVWPLLRRWFERLELPWEPRATLSDKITLTGDFLDSASPALHHLRKALEKQRSFVYETLSSYLQSPQFNKALQDPIITEREGRAVLPVRVEMKSVITGIVHGTSTSGSTLYVEPTRVVELNNQIQALQGEIQQEIDRLLHEISEGLRPYAEPLQAAFDWMGEWDFLLAKVSLSETLHAEEPFIEAGHQTFLNLKRARHPLLVLAHSNPSAVVANDIVLEGDGARVLVITGPNTGGKTVLLKTIGLLALMVKAGLAIPVGEGSRLSLFQEILVDIGDQQDLSQNLSTFSAHLALMRSFLDIGQALTSSLILIDEITAGTDPAEGAALARALLETFHESGALVVTTTHLGELKVVAHDHPGFQNASMLFDADQLSPTFRLVIGMPGASHALTIAEQLGLPHRLLERAKAYLSVPQSQSADLIETLETANRQLSQELETHKK